MGWRILFFLGKTQQVFYGGAAFPWWFPTRPVSLLQTLAQLSVGGATPEAGWGFPAVLAVNSVHDVLTSICHRFSQAAPSRIPDPHCSSADCAGSPTAHCGEMVFLESSCGASSMERELALFSMSREVMHRLLHGLVSQPPMSRRGGAPPVLPDSIIQGFQASHAGV